MRIRITVDDRDETELVHLRQLKDGLSPLHNLVVTRAPLDMIRQIYRMDPSAMNTDVYHDALQHNDDAATIEFLEQFVEPDAYSTDKIANIMHDFYQDGRLQCYRYHTNLLMLARRFPDALIYPLEQNPLTLALTKFEDEDVLADFVQCIPSTARAIDIPFTYGDVRPALTLKLPELTNLQELSLPISDEDDRDKELLKTIFTMITPNGLKSLSIDSTGSMTVTSSAFFRPLMDTIQSPQSALEEFHLYGFSFSAQTTAYQEYMIQTLQNGQSSNLVKVRVRGTISDYMRIEALRSTGISYRDARKSRKGRE